MKEKRSVAILTFALCIFHFAFFLILLGHGAEVRDELEGIRKKIERERRGIASVQEKEGSILQNLGKIDRELDRRNRELRKINSRLESLAADLQMKEEEIAKIGASVKQRRRLLERRLQALYRWQRGGSPFILLNGSFSVAGLMQRKRYLELMLAYDRNLVDHFYAESARQETLKSELAQHREDLGKQRGALLEVKESIRLEREKKNQVLAGLRREREARLRVLKELEQAAHRLQKMMDEISRRAVARPAETAPGVGFEAMKGRLDYPVRGEVIGGFGKTRHPEFSAELFRKGIDIKAPVGEEIRAVEKGRVVFADRFSGYGRMIIIDHGERYYTIYAHLSELLKGTGDTVQRGEPIALVGDSESLVGARLYFEIRKDGRPLDPLPWFSK